MLETNAEIQISIDQSLGQKQAGKGLEKFIIDKIMSYLEKKFSAYRFQIDSEYCYIFEKAAFSTAELEIDVIHQKNNKIVLEGYLYPNNSSMFNAKIFLALGFQQKNSSSHIHLQKN